MYKVSLYGNHNIGIIMNNCVTSPLTVSDELLWVLQADLCVLRMSCEPKEDRIGNWENPFPY